MHGERASARVGDAVGRATDSVAICTSRCDRRCRVLSGSGSSNVCARGSAVARRAGERRPDCALARSTRAQSRDAILRRRCFMHEPQSDERARKKANGKRNSKFVPIPQAPIDAYRDATWCVRTFKRREFAGATTVCERHGEAQVCFIKTNRRSEWDRDLTLNADATRASRDRLPKV